jgi:hypothetical protein
MHYPELAQVPHFLQLAKDHLNNCSLAKGEGKQNPGLIAVESGLKRQLKSIVEMHAGHGMWPFKAASKELDSSFF